MRNAAKNNYKPAVINLAINDVKGLTVDRLPNFKKGINTLIENEGYSKEVDYILSQ